MAQKIVYPRNGGIAVIHPTGALPIDEVARKDVPAGLPYLIVDEADLPSDRTFRAAWDADFSAPDGTGIGAESWFIEQYRAEQQAIEALPAPEGRAPLAALLPEQIEVPAGEDGEPVDADAFYADYLAGVDASNARLAEQHAEDVAAFETERAARIAALEQQVQAMEQQKAAIEAGEAKP